MVKFAASAAGGPVFRWFKSWAWTWHCSSSHAEAVSHMPQLEGPMTRIYNYVLRGFGRKKKEKEKNKIVNRRYLRCQSLKNKNKNKNKKQKHPKKIQQS